jgi:16S rRNA processing protein RimM
LLDTNDFIAIGKIVKSIGIKGNLKIISLTDFPERFNQLKKVFLFDEKKKKFFVNKFNDDYEFVIESCKFYDNYINAKFEKYYSRTESDELVNLILLVREKDRVKLSDGNFYYYELIGIKVYDKDKMIGKVISINNYGSDDLLTIKSGENDVNSKEILIPFRKEFIKKIDIDNKRIDVDLIEGFLE